VCARASLSATPNRAATWVARRRPASTSRVARRFGPGGLVARELGHAMITGRALPRLIRVPRVGQARRGRQDPVGGASPCTDVGANEGVGPACRPAAAVRAAPSPGFLSANDGVDTATGSSGRSPRDERRRRRGLKAAPA
jgi:hypothetical protein